MYCRCREQTQSMPCRCDYQRQMNTCRCQQRVCCRCDPQFNRDGRNEQGQYNSTGNGNGNGEGRNEPAQQVQPVRVVKKEKKSKWAYWKCVTCEDGKVRFLKTNKCPIPRRGYSIQKNPNCKCKKEDLFEPYVENVPTQQTAQNVTTLNTTQHNTNNPSTSENKSNKNSKKDGEKNKKRRHRSKKRVMCCCCSKQAATNRAACCCQIPHTSSRRVPCRCQKPAAENMCCKCKQAQLEKKSIPECYDCVKSYNDCGEPKFVCKKKKPPKDPCENTEEYMLMLDNDTVNSCKFGPTQIIIVADSKCSENPAIELLPIDPFAPAPPCECSAKKRQNDAASRRDSQNPRSSITTQDKSGRSSLENPRKSMETKERPSLQTKRKSK